MFEISNGSRVAAPVPFNASADDVRDAVRSLGPWFDAVPDALSNDADAAGEAARHALSVARTCDAPTAVDRLATVGALGCSWAISLPSELGDAWLLEVNGAGLSGAAAAINAVESYRGRVAEVQAIRTSASSPLYGHFTLSYGGYESTALPYNASASEVGDLSREKTRQDTCIYIYTYMRILSIIDAPLGALLRQHRARRTNRTRDRLVHNRKWPCYVDARARVRGARARVRARARARARCARAAYFTPPPPPLSSLNRSSSRSRRCPRWAT